MDWVQEAVKVAALKVETSTAKFSVPLKPSKIQNVGGENGRVRVRGLGKMMQARLGKLMSRIPSPMI